ncbi:MAG: hypothetical protein U9M90_00590, partial [Patescibacteria group bacterium]|nr:hypothetical protein [Patescibacteria group bacterium]
WTDVLISSMQGLWMNIAAFIPELLSALFVLFIGLIIATAFSKVTHRLFTKVDPFMEKTGVKEELEKIGLKFSLADLAGRVVKWFFIIATLIAVFDILNIPQITEFLGTVVLYIPNVFVAVIILAIGLIVGRLVFSAVRSGLETAKMRRATVDTLAKIAKWAIVIFALMAALTQLGVASDLIKILFTGFVGALSLAGGLAFGLGGKDKAAQWLTKINHKED